MSGLYFRQLFGLDGQTTGKGKVSRSELHGRPLELFMCSVLKRQGYGEGFRYAGLNDLDKNIFIE